MKNRLPPYPCTRCPREPGCSDPCEAWLLQYRVRQKRINGYAKKYKVVPTTMVSGPKDYPCSSCTKMQVCDRICLARARWWDVQMAAVRRKLWGS